MNHYHHISIEEREKILILDDLALQALNEDSTRRHVCKRINEASTNALLQQLDPRLRFSRNYEKLRPYAPYC